MIIDKIDKLLNDAEINYLCDLFLANLGFDRVSPHYRHFRNAVILASRGFLRPAEMYTLLAECAGIDRAEYVKHLKSALATLPVPVHDAYNSAYASESGLDTPIMREGDLDSAVLFLGTVFMYIIVSNYPKYGLVTLNNQQK
ncbi:MAG: hypothetical protein J1G38_00280 [Clostridiales bacterium]|nr:hypothetical protein [Clostridiales bacterium]